MNRTGHLACAVACSSAWTVAVCPDWRWGVIGVPLSTLTAAGWFSPDADQSWLRGLPGGHRGCTHWLGWPVLVAAVLWGVGHPLAWFAWVGWVTHLLGDFLIGEAPMGVPLLPTGRWRIGLGALTPGTSLLRTGTWRETCMAYLVVPGVLGWVLLGHPGWSGL